MRAQLLRDMLAAIAEWSHAYGSERTYWRGIALHHIAEFRRAYLVPERLAFERAVARSQRSIAA